MRNRKYPSRFRTLGRYLRWIGRGPGVRVHHNHVLDAGNQGAIDDRAGYAMLAYDNSDKERVAAAITDLNFLAHISTIRLKTSPDPLRAIPVPTPLARSMPKSPARIVP